MPLFVFEGNSGKLVLPILRPGRPNKRANVTGLMIRLRETASKMEEHLHRHQVPGPPSRRQR